MEGETRGREDVDNKMWRGRAIFGELEIVSSSVVWNTLCCVHPLVPSVSSSVICDFGFHPTLK